MLVNEEKRRVAFVVPTVPLVKQQYDMFRRYLSDWNHLSISGEQQQQCSLTELTPNYDIIIVTPVILLNADKSEL